MVDYEKKYKEALNRAREIHRNEDEKRFDMEWLFPELKESEDEMIRKELIRETKGSEERLFEVVTNEEFIAWLEKQGNQQDKGEISDGYHTFNELYYYRMLYNAAFFNMLPKEWVHKSKRHNDGEECFGGGWFIVMANLPTGQISNHYELKDWDLFQIPEKEVADKWDGHTPQEAADRLHKYLLEKQGNKVSPTIKEEPELISDWITWINEKRYSQKDVDDAYLKGVWETKQELEKQVNCFAKWKKNSADNKPPLKNSVLIKTTNGFAEGEWQEEHWLQYRWSGILKDRDVLYWMELSELEKLGKED